VGVLVKAKWEGMSILKRQKHEYLAINYEITVIRLNCVCVCLVCITAYVGKFDPLLKSRDTSGR